jgi:hypothetical protein
MDISATTCLTWRRIGRLLAVAIALVVVYVGLVLGPAWFRVFAPPGLFRRLLVWLLRGAQLTYVAAVVVVPITVALLIVVLIRARRRGERRPRVARWLALGVAFVLSALVMEAGAFAWQRHLASHVAQLPRIPTRFDDPPNDRVVNVVAVGESSAYGTPFDRWLSVASIVAWQLERAIPDRRFEVEMQAWPGLVLEQMYDRLFRLKHRPDLMIVYAGHNEFQSRYRWDEGRAYYFDQERYGRRPLFLRIARRSSPLCRTIQDTLEKVLISIPPDRYITRKLVDVPVYTRSEYAERLRDFRVRLEAIAAFCEEVGSALVLVIPPGNERDFEPNRSMLSPRTKAAAREAFAREFARLRAAEATDPVGSITGYRALLERQPGFAETHFRLARLLESRGEYEQAYDHYVAARDLDGLPMRLPSDFQRIYHDVAKRHPRAILVDGPALFHRLAPNGIPGDSYFNDGFHPSLAGHTALAQAVLTGLHARGVFDWPRDAPAPVVTPADCAAHYGLDTKCWEFICRASAEFYDYLAFVRHDTTERLAKAERARAASRRIARGTPPEDVGLPGIGIDPKHTSRLTERAVRDPSPAAARD